MSPVETCSDFLNLLRNSQLVRSSILKSVEKQLVNLGNRSDDPKVVAASLVKSHVLTAFQARRLLEGKSDGFYLGKFKLLEILGRGGMGTVYLAEQVSLKRLVALKIVGGLLKSRGDAVARFQREARAIASLNHPNIIRAYDFDEVEGMPYISMEFIEGMDIDRQVRKISNVSWGQAADYAMQTAAGLQHAHQKGFVHRDIKPGNLLVSVSGIVKILDLGLVATKENEGSGSLTTANDQVGTVDFMAPEQALDCRNVDIRADLYSLGGVLYYMLSGQIPLPGKSSAEKLLNHQIKIPRPIQELVPDIPDEMAKVVHRLLAKKPADRFSTPQEVELALKPFAQRSIPPFNPELVKFSCSTFAPVMGRAPDSTSIRRNANMIPGSSDSEGTIDPSNQGTNQGTGKPSSINVRLVQPSDDRIPSSPSSHTSKSASTIVPAKAITTALSAKSNDQSHSSFSGATSERIPTSKAPPVTARPQANVNREQFNKQVSESVDPELLETTDFRSRNRQKRGRKQRRAKLDWSFVAMMAGISLVLIIAMRLTWSRSDAIPNSRSQSDASSASLSSNDNLLGGLAASLDRASAGVSPFPQVPVGKIGYEKWRKFSEEFRLDTRLLLYYPFDASNVTKATVANASSSAKHGFLDAKVINAKWITGRFGEKSGLHFQQDGQRSCLELKSDESTPFDFSRSFTVALWFRSDNPSKVTQFLIGKGMTCWCIRLPANSRQLEFVISIEDQPGRKSIQSDLVAQSITPIESGKWHLVVAVCDVNGKEPVIRLFLDGQAESVMKGGTPKSDSLPLTIGQRVKPASGGVHETWNGSIDEVMILNCALTSSNVQDLFLATKP